MPEATNHRTPLREILLALTTLRTLARLLAVHVTLARFARDDVVTRLRPARRSGLQNGFDTRLCRLCRVHHFCLFDFANKTTEGIDETLNFRITHRECDIQLEFTLQVLVNKRNQADTILEHVRRDETRQDETHSLLHVPRETTQILGRIIDAPAVTFVRLKDEHPFETLHRSDVLKILRIETETQLLDEERDQRNEGLERGQLAAEVLLRLLERRQILTHFVAP